MGDLFHHALCTRNGPLLLDINLAAPWTYWRICTGVTVRFYLGGNDDIRGTAGSTSTTPLLAFGKRLVLVTKPSLDWNSDRPLCFISCRISLGGNAGDRSLAVILRRNREWILGCARAKPAAPHDA